MRLWLNHWSNIFNEGTMRVQIRLGVVAFENIGKQAVGCPCDCH